MNPAHICGYKKFTKKKFVSYVCTGFLKFLLSLSLKLIFKGVWYDSLDCNIVSSTVPLWNIGGPWFSAGYNVVPYEFWYRSGKLLQKQSITRKNKHFSCFIISHILKLQSLHGGATNIGHWSCVVFQTCKRAISLVWHLLYHRDMQQFFFTLIPLFKTPGLL